MAKQIMIYPYSWILFGNNKEQTSNKWNDLDESPANYDDWKKTLKRSYIVQFNL